METENGRKKKKERKERNKESGLVGMETRQEIRDITFFTACKEGQTSVVRGLLAEGRIDLSWPNPGDDLNTPLHVTCLFRHQDILELLLGEQQRRVGELKVNAVNKFNMTPLWWACAVGWYDGAELLMTRSTQILDLAPRCHISTEPTWDNTTAEEVAGRNHRIPGTLSPSPVYAHFADVAFLVRAYQEQVAAFRQQAQVQTPAKRHREEEPRVRVGVETLGTNLLVESSPPDGTLLITDNTRLYPDLHPLDTALWGAYGDETLAQLFASTRTNQAQLERLFADRVKKGKMTAADLQQERERYEDIMRQVDAACKDILRQLFADLQRLLGQEVDPKAFANQKDQVALLLLWALRGIAKNHFAQRVREQAGLGPGGRNASALASRELKRNLDNDVAILTTFYLRDRNLATDFTRPDPAKPLAFPRVTFSSSIGSVANQSLGPVSFGTRT